ncbi:ATP-NAD kinase-like domain-containing protein [Melampsora americana]|nr:ATP-NAD kinase-like domain-containing protein [Melampsora americana]
MGSNRFEFSRLLSPATSAFSDTSIDPTTIPDARILSIEIIHPTTSLLTPAQLITTPDGVILRPLHSKSYSGALGLLTCWTACFPYLTKSSSSFYSYQNILNCSIFQRSDSNQNLIEFNTLTSIDLKNNQVLNLKAQLSISEDLEFAQEWVDGVLSKAYHCVNRDRRMLVVVNPFGGSGQGQKLWDTTVLPIFKAANASFEVIFTTHRGHGIEIGQGIDFEKFQVLVCVSGDGIVHEVLNGIGRRRDAGLALKKISLASIPAGSGNALSVNNMGPQNCRNTVLASLTALKGRPVPLDLCSVTQLPPGETAESGVEPIRMLSFLSTSFGLMADLDVGTENWRWMGETRFILGYLKGALRNPKRPCRLDILLSEFDKKVIETNWIKQRIELNSGSALDEDDESREDRLSSDEEWIGLPSLLYGDVCTSINKVPMSFSSNSSNVSTDSITKDQWYTLEEPITSIYAGTLPFMAADLLEFPMKLTGDGSIDIIVHQSPSVLRTLLCIDGADQGSMFRNHDCRYFKAKAFRLTPLPLPLDKNDEPIGWKSYIVLDGENMPYQSLQAEIHSKLGSVLSLQNRLGEIGVPEKVLKEKN